MKIRIPTAHTAQPARRRKSKKAVRVPRPGTFAAFVVSRPASEDANDVAAAARAANPSWRDATWRKVYHTRWYYGLTERPRVADIATATPTRPAKPVVNVRLPAAVPAAAVGADRVELIRAITRHGTDAARDAIRMIESQHDAVLAKESA